MDRKQAEFEKSLERLNTRVSLWHEEQEDSLLHLDDIIDDAEYCLTNVAEALPAKVEESAIIALTSKFETLRDICVGNHTKITENESIDEQDMGNVCASGYFAYYNEWKVFRCRCGGSEFSACQVCHMDIIVNGFGDFERTLNGEDGASIYEANAPFGPYTCLKCGKEYDELPQV